MSYYHLKIKLKWWKLRYFIGILRQKIIFIKLIINYLLYTIKN
jgi:hypothetical protein